jgi:uncharacterized protein (UPF0303 family)
MTPEEIREQMKETELEHVSAAEARKLGEIIRELAGARGENISIAIRLNGRPVYFAAGDETTPDNEAWISWKQNDVERFRMPSLLLKLQYGGDNGRFLQDRRVNPDLYALAGGGVPICVKNAGQVGSIVVSGLTDEEDHMLCVNGLKELKARG